MEQVLLSLVEYMKMKIDQAIGEVRTGLQRLGDGQEKIREVQGQILAELEEIRASQSVAEEIEKKAARLGVARSKIQHVVDQNPLPTE